MSDFVKKDILKQYELGKEIGKGRNGSVFSFVRICDQKSVAVKIIKFDSSENKKKISEEAIKLRNLKHNYIIQFEETFINQSDDKMYIVMEYA